MSLKATLTSLRAVASTVADRVILAYEVGLFILFKGIVETPLLTDAEVKAFFKSLTDSASMTDDEVLVFGKVETDITAFTDDDALQFGKVPSDTTLFIDAQALDVAKLLSDSGAVSEALVRAMATLYGDSSGASESHSKAFSKAVYEFYAFDYFQEDYVRSLTEVGFADLASLEPNKGLSDGGALTDAHQFGFGKGLSETVFATDDVDGEASVLDDQEFFFFKSLSDVPNATDSQAFAVTRLSTDAFNASESVSVQFGRVDTDNVGSTDVETLQIGKGNTDSATVGELLEKAVSVSFADNSGATDQSVLLVGNVSSDAGAIADAGSLRGQGYSAFDFFAEDYVGYSLTF